MAKSRTNQPIFKDDGTLLTDADLGGLPEITAEDEGKFLGVSSGEPSWQEVSSGTEVVANPTLAGTESALTGLQVGDTKYAVSSGGLKLYQHKLTNVIIDSYVRLTMDSNGFVVTPFTASPINIYIISKRSTAYTSARDVRLDVSNIVYCYFGGDEYAQCSLSNAGSSVTATFVQNDCNASSMRFIVRTTTSASISDTVTDY